MNTVEKTLARGRFQLLLARSMGAQFQTLFIEVMRYASIDFAPVKPQGQQGDWKNDGHEPALGRYYQVYAPESVKEADAVKKIKADFAGLKKRWGNGAVYPIGVREFYFVINDGYRVNAGAYPTTYATLENLRKKHKLHACRPFLCHELEDRFLNLADDQILSIVGFLPNPAEIRVLRLDLVAEVIRHIIENPVARSLDSTLLSPNFDVKIKFNRLNHTGRWLKDADFRRGAVENYFRSSSDFARQAVRDKLTAIYDASEKEDFVDSGCGRLTKEDQQFEWILRQLAPKSNTMSGRQYKDLEDSALVVMAYFFESCDIFKAPIEHVVT